MDKRDTKTVYVLVEPSYIIPVWYSATIEGIKNAAAKQKKNVRQLGSVEQLAKTEEAPAALILVSTNSQWTQSAIHYCREHNIRPILTGGMPSRFGEDVSGTVYGSKSSIEQLVYYFKSCGRRRIALLGINELGSNDITKAEAFLSAAHSLGISASADDIYYNEGGMRNSNERFFNNISCYNGVLCSNDYVAAYVLSYARENSISVPEDLYVAGLGDSILCRYTTPSLTSATRSYAETGEQAFSIWKQLNANPCILSITITVRCEIKPRGSTAFSLLPGRQELMQQAERDNCKLSAGSVLESSNAIKSLANCLSRCDKLDLKIIQKILEGVSTESLAEQLFISTSTARYRLKKIYSIAGTASRREFISLFNSNISGSHIFEDMEGFNELQNPENNE